MIHSRESQPLQATSVVHQRNIIYNLSRFLDSKSIWVNVRPVCRSWKDAIDTIPPAFHASAFWYKTFDLAKPPANYCRLMIDKLSLSFHFTNELHFLKSFEDLKELSIHYDGDLHPDEEFKPTLKRCVQHSIDSLQYFST